MPNKVIISNKIETKSNEAKTSFLSKIAKLTNNKVKNTIIKTFSILSVLALLLISFSFLTNINITSIAANVEQFATFTRVDVNNISFVFPDGTTGKIKYNPPALCLGVLDNGFVETATANTSQPSLFTPVSTPNPYVAYSIDRSNLCAEDTQLGTMVWTFDQPITNPKIHIEDMDYSQWVLAGAPPMTKLSGNSDLTISPTIINQFPVTSGPEVFGCVTPTGCGSVLLNGTTSGFTANIFEKRQPGLKLFSDLMYFQFSKTVNVDTDLRATKSVSPTGSVKPGDILTYTVDVSNLGDYKSTNTIFKDLIPAGTTYVPSSTTHNGTAVPDVGGVMPFVAGKTINSPGQPNGVVQKGSNAVLTFKVKVDANASAPISNQGTVTSNEVIVPVKTDSTALPGTTDPTISEVIAPKTDLSVTKTVDKATTAILNDTLTYDVVFKNNGPDNSAGAIIKDVLPAGTTTQTIVSCTAAGGATCPALALTVAQLQAGFTVNSLPNGGSLNYKISVKAPTKGIVNNIASIMPVIASQDTNLANNSANAETKVNCTVAGAPDLNCDGQTDDTDLKATKTANKPFYGQGETVTYTVVYENKDTKPNGYPTIQDAFPAELDAGTIVSCTTPFLSAYACPNPAITLAQLKAGYQLPFILPAGAKLTYTISGVTKTSGEFTNTATMTPYPGVVDKAPADNTSSVTSKVPVADLKVTKTVDKDEVVFGESVNYTVTYSNAGPDAAPNALLKDAFPAGATALSIISCTPSGAPSCPSGNDFANGVVAPLMPAGSSYTYVFKATLPTINTVYKNTASIVPGTSLDPDSANNTASATTKTKPKAGLDCDYAYGTTFRPPTNGDTSFQITRFDPTGNTFTTLPYVIPGQTTGATISPDGKKLLYFNTLNGANKFTIYDFTTGVTTVGSSNPSGVDPLTINRIGFNPIDGFGYAYLGGSNQNGGSTGAPTLVKIDPDTATILSATQLTNAPGSTVPVASMIGGDIVFGYDGTAYTLDNTGKFFSINTATNQAKYLFNIPGVSSAAGIAFQADGKIIGWDAISNNTYSIDLSNNSITTIPSNTTHADAFHCVYPILDPELKSEKSSTPAGPLKAGDIITYTIKTGVTGTIFSDNTVLKDAIPAGTSYITGTTKLNGAARADVGGAMPYVAGALINSPGLPAGTIYSGAGREAIVTFQVRVNTPIPAGLTDIVNQGTVTSNKSLKTTLTDDVALPGATDPNKTPLLIPIDSDKDGITDNIDLDDDNDGILDTTECSDTNLVANGDFSGGKTGWTSGFTSGAATGPMIFNPGDLVNFVDNAGNLYPNGTIMYNNTPINMIAGQEYKYSIDLNLVPGNTTRTTQFAIVLLDAAGNIVQTLETYKSRAAGTGNILVTQTSPTTFAKSLISDVNGSYRIGMTWLGGGIGASDDVRIDNIILSTSNCDTDRDGIPNALDLDSDGDGCPDAIEGGANFVNTDIVDSTMLGGNTGTKYNGIVSTPVIKNLGNKIGSTPTTIGVPVIAGTGQTIGSALDKNVRDPACIACDLEITKTVSNANPKVGDTITYTVSVKNNGPDAATTSTVTDVLPAGLTFVSATPTPTTSTTPTYTWNLGNIPSGSTQTITYQAKVVATGTLENKASVTTPITDTNLANNNAKTPVVATPADAPKLELIKNSTFVDTNNDSAAQVGEKINYTFNVKNAGNTILTALTITDTKCSPVLGGPIATLAIGATDTTTFTCSYTLTAADIALGKVDNSATVTGKDPTGKDVVDTSDSTDPAKPGLDDPTVTLLPAKAVDDTATTGVNTPVTYSPLANDSVPTGSTITKINGITPVIGTPIIVPNGTATLNTDGSVTFTPNNGFVGTSTFPYEVTTPEGVKVTANDTITVTGAASLELTKTSTLVDTNGNGYTDLGDKLKYVFSVKNTGPLALSNILITDNKCSPITNSPIVALPVGAVNATPTCDYTITAADIAAGKVENTATAQGSDPSGKTVSDVSDDGNNPATTGTDNPTISLLIPKAIDDIKTTALNTPVTYNPLTNDTVPTGSTITLINGVTPVVGTPILVTGGTVTLNPDGTVTVTPNPGFVGDIKFPYEVTTPAGVKVTANDTVTVTGEGKLELIKVGTFVDANANSAAEAGETIKYTFTVKNAGALALTNVKVTDSKCTVLGGPIASLAVGATDTTTFTCSYELTAADITAGKVENTATATGTDPLGKVVTDTSDSTDPAKPGLDDPTVTPLPIKAVDDIKTTPVNTPITYDPKTNDSIPAGSTITSINGVTPTVGTPITVPNGTVTLNTDGTVTVTPNPGFVGDIKFPYVVTTPDGRTTTANDTVTVTGDGKLELIKASTFVDTNNNGNAEVGETIKYTFTVKNAGALTLTNVKVTDNKCTVVGGPIATLAAGATDTTTFTCSYVLTASDITAGKVENTATVTGTDPLGKTVTDTSDSTDPAKPGLDDPTVTPLPLLGKMELIKASTFVDTNNDGAAQVGETLKYTFTVKNTGPVALTNVKVTDSKCTVVGGPIATLAVGATDTTTFTCSYALTAADITAGKVENTAVVTGTDPTGKPVTDNSDSTDPAKPGLDDPTVSLLPIKAVDDIKTTPVNTPVTYDPKTNDSIPAGSTITSINGVTPTVGTPIPVTNGTVTLNTDGTVTVTPNPGFVGDIKFPYVVTTPDGRTTTANDTVTVTGDGKLELIKVGTFVDANANSAAEVGETINYTFTVKNAGALTLTNVKVTDSKCTVLGGPIATLAVGATDTTTFTCSYVLTAADITAGKVENTATVTGTDPTGKVVTDTSDSTDPAKPGLDDPTVTPLPAITPVAVDDIKTTPVNTPVTYNPLENDKVPAGSTITKINGITPVVGTPIIVPGGTVTLNPDGTVTVTPNPGFVGDIKFPYEVTTPTGVKVTANDTVTITGEGKLELIKVSTFVDTNNDGAAQVGETLKYTFTVKNAGALALTNVKVTDSKCTVLGGPIATLAVGATDTTTFTCSYTLTAADITAGKVENTAVVTGTDPTGKVVTDTSDSTDPTKPGLDDPTISPLPIKAVDDIKTTPVNTPVTYDPKTNDSIPAGSTITSINGVTPTVGTPIPVTNGTVTLNTDGTVTVTPNPGFVGDIKFPYVVTTPDGRTTTANDTVTVTGDGKLELIKASTFVDANANSAAEVGETINYTFTVKNAGALALTNVKVTDSKCTVLGSPIATLAVGATDTTTFTCSYTLTAADITAGKVENTAVVTGTDPTGKVVTDTSDSTDPAKPGLDDPTVTPLPAITPIAVDDIKTTPVNTPVTYSPTANDTVPTGSTITKINGVTPVVGTPILVTGGTVTLNPDGTVTVTPNPGFVGDIKFPYEVTTPAGVKVNANDTVTVTGEGKLELIKVGTFVDTDSNGYSNVGDKINYTFTVKNAGALALTNVKVTDSKCTVLGGPIATLAVAATDTTTFTCSYTLTAADITLGKVENTAVVTGTDPTGKVVTDTSDSTDPTKQGLDDPTVTPLTPQPLVGKLEVIKAGSFVDTDTNGYASIGDKINYTFTIKNTGTAPLTNVTLTDNKCTVVGGPIATLAVGATDTTTFTCSYTLTATDIAAGKVENTATATGTDPTGKVVTDTSDSTDPTKPGLDDPTIVPLPIKAIDDSKTTTINTPVTYSPLANDIVPQGSSITKINGITAVAGTPIVVTGGTVTLNNDGTVTVTPNTGFTGNIVFPYEVTSIDGQKTTATDTVTIPPVVIPANPMLELDKSSILFDTNGNGYSDVGDTINYSFVVKNTGNVVLSNVNITDNKCSPIVGGPVATMQAGAVDSTTFKCTYTLTAADITASKVDNQATATATDPSGNVITAVSNDPKTTTPKDPTTTELTPKPEPLPVLIDDNKVTTFNTPITYNPTINDTIPAGSKITAINGVPLIVGTQVKVLNGTVVLNSDGTLTVTPDFGFVGDIKFPYEVTTPSGTKATANDTVTVNGVGKVEIDKAATYVDTNADGKLSLGETVKYVFTIKNTGTTTLTNVIVTDTLPGIVISGMPISSMAPGTTNATAYTATYVVTQADVDREMVVNQATVSGKDPSGNVVKDLSNDPSTILGNDPTTLFIPKPVVITPPPVCPACPTAPTCSTCSSPCAGNAGCNSGCGTGCCHPFSMISNVTNTNNVTITGGTGPMFAPVYNYNNVFNSNVNFTQGPVIFDFSPVTNNYYSPQS
jgi:uncharacterized repeat protein (TIGR01451 family)